MKKISITDVKKGDTIEFTDEMYVARIEDKGFYIVAYGTDGVGHAFNTCTEVVLLEEKTEEEE